MAIDPWADAPCLTLASEDTTLETMLTTVSRLLLQHPAIAQSLFSSLVSEGRRFAATEEGRRWRKALAGSDLVLGGRALWEASALNFLEDEESAVLPSAIIDAVAYAATRPDLHEKLPALLHD